MQAGIGLFALTVAVLGSTVLGAAEPRTTARAGMHVTTLSPPATTGAIGPSVTRAPDGTLWLSWVEPAATATGDSAFKMASFDAHNRGWHAPRIIARGANWFLNTSDFPVVSIGQQGRATAVWFVNNPPTPATAHDHHGAGYHALVSRSADAGQTWSAPAPLSRESTSVEFVSLATLADGRVLAVWLDGRGKKAGGTAQQLYSRIVGEDGPDTLVDASVCDCCQTTLTAFPDGTALVAYRGRTTEEIRDIRLTRFRGQQWDASRPLNNDAWKIVGCPVNGPQLDADGGRVAAAWFTAADGNPRVLASYSPDAGTRFLAPLQIDAGKPSGRVDTLLLHDGAMLVTWVEADGSAWARRVSPDFALSESIRLNDGKVGAVKGFPRIALLRDYSGGDSAAEFLATFMTEGAGGGLRTVLVTVPEGDMLEAEKSCDCAPTAEQLQGYPIRGTVAAALSASATLRVRHFEVPGIFPEGLREFNVAPGVLAAATPGRQFLGRIDKRDGAWWLVDVRLAATTVAPSRTP